MSGKSETTGSDLDLELETKLKITNSEESVEPCSNSSGTKQDSRTSELNDSGRSSSIQQGILDRSDDTNLNSEKDADREPRLNPLDIDLILKLTLRSLSMSSLLSCRLVNRDWNSLAVQRIRKRIKVKRIKIKAQDFTRFCRDFDQCAVLPFTSLGFVLEDLNLPSCDKFFARHGHSIYDLDIMEVSVMKEAYSELVTRRILKTLQCVLGQSPNLKKLSLFLHFIPLLLSEPLVLAAKQELRFRLPQVDYLKINCRKGMTTEFMDALFATVPNLQVVEFGSLSPGQRQADELLEAIQKLQFVHVVSTPVSKGRLGLFRAIASTQKLKKLTFCLESGEAQTWEVVQAQEDLLLSQAGHLERLSLLSGSYDENDDNEDVPKLNLPVMETVTRASLVYLHLQYNPERVPFNLVPLKPEQMPNLRILRISPRFLKMGVLSEVFFASVTQLILRNHQQEYLSVLPEIAKRFPNLKQLDGLRILNFDASDMALIASSWPEMEQLQICVRTDSSRQTRSKNQLGNGSGDEEWRKERQNQASLEPFNAGPSSLPHLKNLRRLVLEFCGPETQALEHRNDLDVYWSFSQLPTKLRLDMKGRFSISDDLRALLTARYQRAYLKPAKK